MINNENFSEKNEIGSSISANQLVYSSIDKIIKENDKNNKAIKLYQIKCKIYFILVFYEREEALVAIQFILKNFKLSDEKNMDVLIYMEPKILGPIDTYIAKKTIDEITLNIGQDEEIYLIKGYFESIKKYSKNLNSMNRITKLCVYTTNGQFVEIGKPNQECNFAWEYYFNLKFFDGFIIGWDETSINYLAALTVEKPIPLDEKNIVLSTSAFDNRLINIDPIYLSPRYGRFDSFTTFEDDLIKKNIFQQVKDGDIYISEVTIYYDKSINDIETEYTNKKTKEKFKATHIGTDSKLI